MFLIQVSEEENSGAVPSLAGTWASGTHLSWKQECDRSRIHQGCWEATSEQQELMQWFPSLLLWVAVRVQEEQQMEPLPLGWLRL